MAGHFLEMQDYLGISLFFWSGKKKASFALSASCAARGGHVTCLVREMSPEVCCGCPGQLLISLWKGEPAGGALSLSCPFPSSFMVSVGFPGGSDDKQSAYSAGDLGSIPRSGRSPGEGDGSPLQYSCLEDPMDRGAWRATVRGVAKSQKDWETNSTHVEGLQPLTDNLMGHWCAIAQLNQR